MPLRLQVTEGDPQATKSPSPQSVPSVHSVGASTFHARNGELTTTHCSPTNCLLRLGQQTCLLRARLAQVAPQPNPLLLNLSFLTGPPFPTPQPVFCPAFGLPSLKPPSLLKGPASGLYPTSSSLLEQPRTWRRPSPSHPPVQPDTCNPARSRPPRPAPPAPSPPPPAPAVPHQRPQRACARARSPPCPCAPWAGRSALIGRLAEAGPGLGRGGCRLRGGSGGGALPGACGKGAAGRRASGAGRKRWFAGSAGDYFVGGAWV